MLAVGLMQPVSADDPPLQFAWQHINTGTVLPGDPWSPDSQYIAVYDSDQNAVLILNVTTWQVERQFPLPAPQFRLFSLAWSPNGNYIALLGSDSLEGAHAMAMLNLVDQSIVFLTPLLADVGVFDMRWMGSTNSLATFSPKGYIAIIDVAHLEFDRGFQLDRYSPDGLYFFVGFDWSSASALFAAPLYSSATIGFWDASGMLSSDLVREETLGQNIFGSQCGAWLPEGTAPLDFSFDYLDGNVALMDLEWSNDGLRLALVGGYEVTVCTLNAQRTEVIQIHSHRIPDPSFDPNSAPSVGFNDILLPRNLVWSPNGHWLITSILDFMGNSCGLAVFDATQNFAFAGFVGQGLCNIGNMSWSPDGSQIALDARGNGLWIGTLLAG
jgi:WD40 repeat protein